MQDPKSQLKEKIKQLTQFPVMERDQPYQSYYIGDEYVKGSRDIQYRFDKFNIVKNLSNIYSVVDLGCNLGGIAQLAYKRGAKNVTGIDYEKDYIECAKSLAEYNTEYIAYIQMDLKQDGIVENFINKYYPNGIDMIFMLAIDKHIRRDRCFQILDRIKFKSLFWEGSSAKDENTTHVIQTNNELKKRYKDKVKQLGFINDRNKRFIWRIDL